VVGASFLTIVVVFYFCRRSSSRRSIVPAVLTIAALTIAFAMAVRPTRLSADRALYNNILARTTLDLARNWKAVDLDQRTVWWQDIQSGVAVIPFALLGVVLARRKGWRVAATIAGFFLTWTLLVFILISLDSFPPPSVIMQRWREIALMFTVAVVWLTLTSSRGSHARR
jgi:hypothetical protein